MKLIKKILIAIVAIPIVLALIVAFGTAPMGKEYVNTHGEELIGRKINIDDFKFNILTGGIGLDEVTIYEPNGDSVFASVEDIDLDLSMIDLMQGKVHIESLDIKHPAINVVQKDTVFNFDDVLTKLSEGESSEYTIDEFTLKGGEINYIDLSVPAVPFTYRLDKLKVESENFSTADRNHILFSARLGSNGKVDATYDGMLSDQNNMQLALTLEEVDLTEFSALFVQLFGREVISGTLDLTTEMSTINGHINGTNHVVITDPKVEKIKDLPFKPEYRKVPLKTALYVMTDKNGKCEMDLPVKGSKDDPKFSYKRALMKVFSKFIVKLVTSPFSHFKHDDE